jgi:hypothetical protein
MAGFVSVTELRDAAVKTVQSTGIAPNRSKSRQQSATEFPCFHASTRASLEVLRISIPNLSTTSDRRKVFSYRSIDLPAGYKPTALHKRQVAGDDFTALNYPSWWSSDCGTCRLGRTRTLDSLPSPKAAFLSLIHSGDGLALFATTAVCFRFFCHSMNASFCHSS